MSQKYQREIEEILEQTGDLSPPSRISRPKQSILRLIWLYARQSLDGKTWSLSPGRIMLIAIILLLSALILGPLFPGGLVSPLAWGGLLLFIVGYGMFFIRPPKIEKRWRGQSLEEPNDSWLDRLRQRLK